MLGLIPLRSFVQLRSISSVWEKRKGVLRRRPPKKGEGKGERE